MALDDISTSSMSVKTKQSNIWVQDNDDMKCMAKDVNNYAMFAQIGNADEWRLIRPKSCDNAMLTRLLTVLYDYAHKENLVPARTWHKDSPPVVATPKGLPPGVTSVKRTFTLPAPGAAPEAKQTPPSDEGVPL